MKTFYKLLLTLALSACAFTVKAQYSFQADGFYFKILSEGDATVEVTHGEAAYAGDIVIPNTARHGMAVYNVVGIGDEAFKGDEFVTSIIFGKNIRSIGERAFSGNVSLSEIIIPDHVTELKKGCFGGCSHLTAIHIGEGIDSIPEGAFSGSAVQQLHIGSNVKYIGDKAFQGKSGKLSEIRVPKSVKYIGQYAFSHHTRVTTLDLGTVEQIEECAFSHLSALKELTLPNTLKTIGKQAFMQCSALKSIYIPSSVTMIWENPFQGCDSLTFIKVAEDNKVYDSRNGCNAIIRTNTDCIITACKTTVIPDDTKYLASFSFSSKSITRIELPQSLIMIQPNAFYGSNLKYAGIDNLESWMRIDFLKIDANPTFTTESLIVNGEELTHLRTPEEITTIKSFSFASLDNLTRIELHKGIQTISAYAFIGCTNIKEVVTYAETPSLISSASFTDETYQNATLYVPAGTKDIYSADYYWKNFKKIAEMTDTGIDDNEAETSVRDIYSINGGKSNIVRKGMNIIRFSNGELKKIYIK
jgi:hypothetical protein